MVRFNGNDQAALLTMKRVFLHLLVVAVASTLLFPAIGTADGPIAGPVPDARIVIFKEQRLLQLFSGNDLVREYHIGLGFEPEVKGTLPYS